MITIYRCAECGKDYKKCKCPIGGKFGTTRTRELSSVSGSSGETSNLVNKRENSERNRNRWSRALQWLSGS